MTLQLVTDYTYAPYDNCNWRSVQDIGGTLSSGRLQFSYKEAPLPEQTDCAIPCTGKGDVFLKPS